MRRTVAANTRAAVLPSLWPVKVSSSSNIFVFCLVGIIKINSFAGNSSTFADWKNSTVSLNYSILTHFLDIFDKITLVNKRISNGWLMMELSGWHCGKSARGNKLKIMTASPALCLWSLSCSSCFTKSFIFNTHSHINSVTQKIFSIYLINYRCLHWIVSP